MNERRGFLCTGFALITADAARAQQVAKIPRVAMLWFGTAPASLGATSWEFRFLQRFKELGYIDGGSVRIDSQYAASAKLPAIDSSSQTAREGGLISYGIDFGAHDLIAAEYVSRILKGAKPGDLPVQQPTRFESIVNLKTAKALGITIPQTLLIRADEVIQ